MPRHHLYLLLFNSEASNSFLEALGVGCMISNRLHSSLERECFIAGINKCQLSVEFPSGNLVFLWRRCDSCLRVSLGQSRRRGPRGSRFRGQMFIYSSVLSQLFPPYPRPLLCLSHSLVPLWFSVPLISLIVGCGGAVFAGVLPRAVGSQVWQLSTWTLNTLLLALLLYQSLEESGVSASDRFEGFEVRITLFPVTSLTSGTGLQLS